MREIKAGEFKAKCLKLLDEVAETGEPIVVTKHGKPVACVKPAIEPASAFFGRGADNVRIIDPNDDLIDTLSSDEIDAWYSSAAVVGRPKRKRPA